MLVRGKQCLFVCILFILAAFAAGATASDCPSLGSTASFGPENRAVRDIAYSGNLAFSADLFGLTIRDISDPAAPPIVGELRLSGEGTAIALADQKAFVGEGSSGVAIIDIADPTMPQLISVVWTYPFVSDVLVSGNILYVSRLGNGIILYDISDPASPHLLDQVDTLGFAEALSLYGDYLLVADGGSGLGLVDVSDPENSYLLSWCDTPGYAVGVDVSGDLAWVADFSGGLQVIDISDPAEPLILGACDTPGYAEDIRILGDTAYIADYWEGLAVIDAGNPAAPMLVDSINSPDAGYVVALALAPSRLLLGQDEAAGTQGGLEILDIATPQAPVELSRIDSPGWAEALVLGPSYAYVADGNAGLGVLDLENPDAPAFVGVMPLPGYAGLVAISSDGGKLAVGLDTSVALLNLDDPAEPAVTATIPIAGAAGLAFEDGILYITHGKQLSLHGLSDPAAPVLLGEISLPSTASGLAVRSSLAYICDRGSGLQIVDCSQPHAPEIRGVLTWGYPHGRPVLSGNLLYLASSDNSFVAVDVSDPASPRFLGDLSLAGFVAGIEVARAQAWVAVENVGLEVINLSNPGILYVTTTVSVPRTVWGIALDRETATAWLPAGGVLAGIDVGCASCTGLRMSADPPTIMTGGNESLITIDLLNNFGRPEPGASLYVSTDLGWLTPLTDQGDGSYTTRLLSESVSGNAHIRVRLDSSRSSDCPTILEVPIQCSLGILDPPALQAESAGDTSVSLSWIPVPGSESLQLYRDDSLVAQVDPGADSFLDSNLVPGSRYCYRLGVTDQCGGEFLSEESCARTDGEIPGCLVDAGFSLLDWRNRSRISGLDVRGNILYTADASGLGIWSLSDPASPQHLGYWIAPEAAADVVALPDGIVVLSSLASGLIIIDASDPSSPLRLACVDAFSAERLVAVSDSIVYVASTFSFRIYDISNPLQPLLIGVYGLNRSYDQIPDLAISGDRLLVADNRDGLIVFDISDPVRPVRIGEFGDAAYLVAAGGDRAAIKSDAGLLEILDISDPSAIQVLGTYSYENSDLHEILIQGSTLFAAEDAGLEIIDISDPANPTRLLLDPARGIVSALEFSPGGKLVRADDEFGLALLDVGTPASPVLLGLVDTDHQARDVAISGEYAFVANENRGLAVVDISELGQPRYRRTLETPGSAEDLIMVSNLVFLADGEAGLEIIDVSDPETPVLIGSWDSPGEVHGVAVEGDRAFVADDSSGLEILDISNPGAPVLLGSFLTRADAWTVDVSGDLVAVGERNGSYIELVDITDPAAPLLLSRQGFGYSHGIRISGDRLYALVASTLRVYDISDPSEPVVLGNYYDYPTFTDLEIRGGLVFLLGESHWDEGGQLLVLDLSTPSDFKELEYLNLRRNPLGLCTSGDEAAVATSEGLQMVTVHCRVPLAGFSWRTRLLDAEFRNTSIYGYDTVHWDFGDGSFSNEDDPLHAYTVPGVYTATLSVTNPQGSDTLTLPVEILGPEVFEDDFESGDPSEWDFASGY